MLSANKKVLHLINGEFYSGAERVQDLLASGLPEFGFDPWLACVKPDKFIARCACDKSRILEFPMRSRIDLTSAIRIVRYAKANKIVLIHTHTPRTAMLGLIVGRLLGVPVVHHLHSPTSRDTEHPARNRINTFVETFVMKRVDQIVAVSNSLQVYLLHMGIPESRISVVWNGVPLAAVLPERSVPGKCWVLGTVALFRARKGLEVLLKAVANLIDSGLRLRIMAVGDFETDEYRREILGLVEKLGIERNVDWVGFVQDISTQFNKMDVFVLPSLYGEGLPMVVLEAMANGVPVISTKVEGVVEAIPDINIGSLVEPGNEKQLADTIRLLVESPELWGGQRRNAYQRQVKYFSSRSMSEGVARVYEHVLTV